MSKTVVFYLCVKFRNVFVICSLNSIFNQVICKRLLEYKYLIWIYFLCAHLSLRILFYEHIIRKSKCTHIHRTYECTIHKCDND